MIAAHSIAALRDVPLPVLVADYVTLRKSGPRWTAPCPFHKERTASFTVYKDHYYCFGCGAKGSSVDFLMRVENLPFPRAAEAVAQRFGVTLDPSNLTRTQAAYAAHEAEFCQWWWGRWQSEAEAQMYAALDRDDEAFADCAGRLLVHYRAMTPLARYKFFQAAATVRDRKDWEEHREWERAFENAWMGLGREVL